VLSGQGAIFHLALRQTKELIGPILHLPRIDLPVLDHSTIGRPHMTVSVFCFNVERKSYAPRRARGLENQLNCK
jgi:hypothetical protein